MALRVGIQRSFQAKLDEYFHTFRRLTHAFAISPSFNNSIDTIPSPPLCEIPESHDHQHFSCEIPESTPGGGSLDLMAVPKKRTSRHKRGIRNGPKALKPTPVIVKCMSCGRVKLPHFYCCGGRKEDPGERNGAIN